MANKTLTLPIIYKENFDIETISYKDYLSIMIRFLKFFIQKLFEGNSIDLPFSLGTMYIKGTKVKPIFLENGLIAGLSPNWRKTKELWDSDKEAKKNKQLVYDFNEHSDNIRYKLSWKKRKLYAKYKWLYGFILTRHNKRTLSKLIKEGRTFVINNVKKKNYDIS